MGSKKEFQKSPIRSELFKPDKPDKKSIFSKKPPSLEAKRPSENIPDAVPSAKEQEVEMVISDPAASEEPIVLEFSLANFKHISGNPSSEPIVLEFSLAEFKHLKG